MKDKLYKNITDQEDTLIESILYSLLSKMFRFELAILSLGSNEYIWHIGKPENIPSSLIEIRVTKSISLGDSRHPAGSFPPHFEHCYHGNNLLKYRFFTLKIDLILN